MENEPSRGTKRLQSFPAAAGKDKKHCDQPFARLHNEQEGGVDECDQTRHEEGLLAPMAHSLLDQRLEQEDQDLLRDLDRMWDDDEG